MGKEIKGNIITIAHPVKGSLHRTIPGYRAVNFFAQTFTQKRQALFATNCQTVMMCLNALKKKQQEYNKTLHS
jgi:hypothetical protein